MKTKKCLVQMLGAGMIEEKRSAWVHPHAVHFPRLTRNWNTPSGAFIFRL